MKLEGKVVVITGGGSGMGRAMANLFSDEGAKVVIGDWNENSMNEVIAELQAKVECYPSDPSTQGRGLVSIGERYQGARSKARGLVVTLSRAPQSPESR